MVCNRLLIYAHMARFRFVSAACRHRHGHFPYQEETHTFISTERRFMRYLTGVYWSKGAYRSQNQDAVLLLQTLTGRGRVLLAAVCDGMGGHAQGDLASAHVSRALQEWYYEYLLAAVRKKKRIWVIHRALDRLVYQLQDHMKWYCDREEIQMGTTLSVLVLFEGKYLLWNLGDSRIYRFTGKKAECLTVDHVSAEGRLTKCVGGFGYFVPDHRYGAARKGEGFLLCSDGFYRQISREELWDVLAASQLTDEEQICRHLKELADCAERRGERDNLSAVYIKLN